MSSNEVIDLVSSDDDANDNTDKKKKTKKEKKDQSATISTTTISTTATTSTTTTDTTRKKRKTMGNNVPASGASITGTSTTTIGGKNSLNENKKRGRTTIVIDEEADKKTPSSSGPQRQRQERAQHGNDGNDDDDDDDDDNKKRLSLLFNFVSFSKHQIKDPPDVALDDDGLDNAVMTSGILRLVSALRYFDTGLYTCDGTMTSNEEKSIIVSSSSVVTAAATRNEVEKGSAGNSNERKNGITMLSSVRHIQQNDKWSCGYRNLQMILTSIIPYMKSSHNFFQYITRREEISMIPTIKQIQSNIEQSWINGYDPKGAKHYNYNLIHRTKPKIGAVEVSSILTYWSIDSTVIQFITCYQSRSLLTKFIRLYFAQTNVVIDSDSNGDGSGSTKRTTCNIVAKQLLSLLSSSTTTSNDKTNRNDNTSSNQNNKSSNAAPNVQIASAATNINDNTTQQDKETSTGPVVPLYLQWEGHSVTVVGIDSNDNLICFDPMTDGESIYQEMMKKNRSISMKQTDQRRQSVASSSSSSSSSLLLPNGLKLSSQKLLQKDVQIVMCSIHPLKPRERNLRKIEPCVITAAEESVLQAIYL